jgi:hypothetical protein
MPHAVLQLPHDRFQEDLPYDVQVELELVRPSARAEETGTYGRVTLALNTDVPRQLYGHTRAPLSALTTHGHSAAQPVSSKTFAPKPH